MSHFAVLVVGPNPDKQLQPFHEFECTGENDEFVQELDVTEEELNEAKNASISMVRLADGTEVSRYNDVCYRFPTPEEDEKRHRIDRGLKIWQLPEGAVEFEKSFESAADYLRYAHHQDFVVPFGEKPDIEDEHMYGYALLGEDGAVTKVIRRTNPNRKWDWWVVGGRWSGSLLLKGTNTRVNQARKRAIDFDKMRDQAGMEAAEQYDKVTKIVDGRAWLSWKEVLEKHVNDIDTAREEFHAQDVIKDFLRPENRDMFGFFEDFSSYKLTREKYIARARASAVSFFALLKDGQWYERGEMGWWGVVSDEKDIDTWNQKFQELLDSLPDNTLLTVVDCHI